MYLKLYFLVMTFSFNMVEDTKALNSKLRSYFQGNNPCALIYSGNRTWERRCKSRRDVKIDSTDLASRERGPSSPDHADHGYVPYWEFGDWVYNKIRPKKGEITMCGSQCPEQYLMLGRICAVNKEMTTKTYENYCELRDQDCEDIDGWKVAYRGACLGVPQPIPTDANELVVRAEYYLKEMNKTTG